MYICHNNNNDNVDDDDVDDDDDAEVSKRVYIVTRNKVISAKITLKENWQ